MYLPSRVDLSTANPTAASGDQLAQTVLLVEPDLATRQLYTRALRQRWQVTAVHNIAEAVGALGSGLQPQIVVIEPYADGSSIDWGQLAALRDEFCGPASVPVVLCSTLDERRNGYAWGAALYLVKPVTPDRLVAELANFLL